MSDNLRDLIVNVEFKYDKQGIANLNKAIDKAKDNLVKHLATLVKVQAAQNKASQAARIGLALREKSTKTLIKDEGILLTSLKRIDAVYRERQRKEQAIEKAAAAAKKANDLAIKKRRRESDIWLNNEVKKKIADNKLVAANKKAHDLAVREKLKATNTELKAELKKRNASKRLVASLTKTDEALKKKAARLQRVLDKRKLAATKKQQKEEKRLYNSNVRKRSREAERWLNFQLKKRNELERERNRSLKVRERFQRRLAQIQRRADRLRFRSAERERRADERRIRDAERLQAVNERNAQRARSMLVTDTRQNARILGRQVMAFGRQAYSGFSDVVQKGAKFEKTAASFEALTGSKEASDIFMDKLTNFAATTPFKLEETRKDALMLTGMGFKWQNVIPILNKLGAVAAGLPNATLNRIALNYGQVRAQGYLTGRDRKDFSSAGINMFDELGKITGKSEGELTAMMANRAIPFKLVEEVFTRMTSEGGRFYELLEKIANSASGMYNNILIYITRIKEMAGLDLLKSLKPLLKRTKAYLKDHYIEIASVVSEKMQLVLNSVLKLGPLLMTMGSAIITIARHLTVFADLVSSIVATIFRLKTGVDEVGESFTALVNKIEQAGAYIALVIEAFLVYKLAKVVTQLIQVVLGFVGVGHAALGAARGVAVLNGMIFALVAAAMLAKMWFDDIDLAISDPANMRKRTVFGKYIEEITAVRVGLNAVHTILENLLRLVSFGTLDLIVRSFNYITTGSGTYDTEGDKKTRADLEALNTLKRAEFSGKHQNKLWSVYQQFTSWGKTDKGKKLIKQYEDKGVDLSGSDFWNKLSHAPIYGAGFLKDVMNTDTATAPEPTWDFATKSYNDQLKRLDVDAPFWVPDKQTIRNNGQKFNVMIEAVGDVFKGAPSAAYITGK